MTGVASVNVVCCECVPAQEPSSCKIAAVFKLQPASLYLVKEFENVVIFPHEQSGRFNRSQVDSSYTYEVRGDEVSDPGTPSHAVVSKLFSAYTGPSYHSASSPSLSVSTPR